MTRLERRELRARELELLLQAGRAHRGVGDRVGHPVGLARQVGDAALAFVDRGAQVVGRAPQRGIALGQALRALAPRALDGAEGVVALVAQRVAFAAQRPQQVVVGNGGVTLDPAITAAVAGTQVDGAMVATFETVQKFGYVVLQKVGKRWDLRVKDETGRQQLRFDVR